MLITVGLAFIAAMIGAAWALAADVAPKSMVASVSAIQNFGGYFGGAFSPVVAGFIVDKTGSYSLAFISAASSPDVPRCFIGSWCAGWYRSGERFRGREI